MSRTLTLMTVLLLTFAGIAVVPRSADAVVPGAVGRILFWSDSDNANGELYTRDFSGGPWTRLTSDTIQEREADWSPDGSQIAYGSNAHGTYDIWIMDADGGTKHSVTNDGFDNVQPSWSPDGGRIAYTSIRGPALPDDIWVMNADGSGKTNLTPLSATSQDFGPAWSPDGSAIAFVSDRDGSADIFLMSTNGKRVNNLTNSPTSVDLEPAWSPDGTQIVYTSIRGLARDLYVMDADGSNDRRLTNTTAYVQNPAWSPDGRHILFTSTADGDFDLWMVNPDGTGLGHLTDHPGTEGWGAWESVDRPPVAVGDGPYFVRTGAVLNGVSVLVNDTDPDGETLTAKLVSGPLHVASFTLNADGSFVYRHDGSSVMSDSFTYAAKDPRGGVSNTATVTVRVGPVDTVGLVDPGTGVWRLRNQAGVVSSFFYGNPGDYPFVGDWDCDGVDTPGLYRQSDGFAYLRNSNTQGIADRTFFFGNPSDVPLAGDFNGDGCDTLSIYRPSEARFYIINQLGKDGGGLGAADYDFLFGNPGDQPVVGDWDGDGVDEVGLHRESTGFFYYRDTLTTGVADGAFFFGDPGDRFVAGDWGVVDGRDTPALFRPSDVTFYFRHTMTQGNADSQFTWTGMTPSRIPVAADFGLG